MKEFLSKLRKDYGIMGLNEADLNPDPIKQFETWFTEAANAEIVEPNAFTLSTVSALGKPTSRIVLLRNFDQRGFTFYSNYQSRKGSDMEANPNVSMNFFWPDVERQIRINGTVVKLSRMESMDYFKSRPRPSQIGAWASEQSQVLLSKQVLEQRIQEIEKRFEGIDVEIPPFWGGYCVRPIDIEFWQGRPGRLHDRLRYTKQEDETWIIERLNP
jgi:pyridoxamine 5'-phosphate oxidase